MRDAFVEAAKAIAEVLRHGGNLYVDYCGQWLYCRMTPREFKRWLASQGCTFSPGRGGHLKVRRGHRMSVLPMHGQGKELGTGLMQRIKKDLGLTPCSTQ